ncbi:IS5/IS1182 family transposase OS=Streptomyces globisporus OX=1908 GN=D3105_32180 PE=4 SV=1 [Streptomyces griseus subsp. griseus]
MLVPTRCHTIAERSKNCRYSANIRSSSTLTSTSSWWVAQYPGNRHVCEAQEGAEAKASVGTTITSHVPARQRSFT